MGTSDTIRPAGAGSIRQPMDEKQKARLQKAMKEFESVFVGYMLKSMRAGTQESGMFGESFGGDLLSGMFDTEFAKHISGSSSLGLAEIMYRRLTGESLPRVQQHLPRPARNIPAATAGQPASQPAAMPPAPQQPAAATGPASAASKQTSVPPAAPVQQPAPAAASVARATPTVRPAIEDRMKRYESIIKEAAEKHGVDSALIKAVIAVESGGISNARSSADAKGVMQLIDSTAADMGVKNVWNPRDNIMGGTKYLKQMMELFPGDVKHALASYNAGPGAVMKYNGIPPFRETRDYVKRVMNYFTRFQQEQGHESD